MQKQRNRRQTMPRFVKAAVLSAGLMLSCGGAQQQMPPIQPQQTGQEKPLRDAACTTIRDAMHERVGSCKDSPDFSKCVFGKRMLFSTKYESTEQLTIETGLKQDVLADAGIALMSEGRSRGLLVREIRPDGVWFEMRFGKRKRPTVQIEQRELAIVGGMRKLEHLDRVKGGEFFYRFGRWSMAELNVFVVDMDSDMMSVGRTSNGVKVRLGEMGVDIISVKRTPNGVRIQLVADIYENCLVE